jgi:hypothetical protein
LLKFRQQKSPLGEEQACEVKRGLLLRRQLRSDDCRTSPRDNAVAGLAGQRAVWPHPNSYEEVVVLLDDYRVLICEAFGIDDESFTTCLKDIYPQYVARKPMLQLVS